VENGQGPELPYRPEDGTTASAARRGRRVKRARRCRAAGVARYLVPYMNSQTGWARPIIHERDRDQAVEEKQVVTLSWSKGSAVTVHAMTPRLEFFQR
jgi:hypothetical protein